MAFRERHLIVVATTLHAYVMDNPDHWGAWLRNAEQMIERTDQGLRFFAAEETDARGLAPFGPLIDRLMQVDGDAWTFRFDDGADSITTDNRLRRITIGQNLATMYALDVGASHMLFLAADLMPPIDAVPKLLEMQWPIVGGECPTYCLSGDPVDRHPATGQLFGFPVESHMATAAFVMVQRDLLKRIRWRYDTDTNMSDDPCLHHDALELGYETLVRKDCVGVHYPVCVGPIETRGHDMRVFR